MKIRISEDYMIETDPFCWMVKERSVVKEGKNAGKELWKAVGYYGTLSQAITGLSDRAVRVSDAETLEQALTAAGAIADSIRAALTPEYTVEAR